MESPTYHTVRPAATVQVCNLCASLVESPATHNEWHLRMLADALVTAAQEIVLRSSGRV